MNKTAFLFPGQGSQYVGMGVELSAKFVRVKESFEEADEILGFDLSKLIFEGPSDELVKTKNTQPAILSYSVALMRVLEDEGKKPDIVAGHSLGEYSALVCAGSISYRDALLAVRLRGQLMYEAGLRKPGTMAAILGMEPDEVEKVCHEASSAGIVEPANFNSPVQIVISGDVNGVKEAMEVAKRMGAKRVIQLDVSGAFHSSLMEEALPGLKNHLDDLSISDGAIPLVANVNAKGTVDREEIREGLKSQLMKPVLWSDSIRFMMDYGVSRFVEVGPGKVLCQLLKKNDRSLKGVTVDGVEEIESCISSEGGGAE
jgi:[acyl-carrier-protein] S-malonyltransferase